MDLGQIKAYYERFKRWQQAPTDYEFASDAVQHCLNCGHDFTGNYCPYCSQKAGEGQISWHSVRQSFMDIWGTLWRVLIVFGVIVYAIESLMSLLFGVLPSPSEQSVLGSNKYLFASIQLGYGLVLLALGWLIDLVARKASHKVKH